jgi:site-specific DNA-methyltransferase (adenine-specific)
MIIQGDCLDVLKTIQDNCIDSLVTDPPAGISFMQSKKDDWDSDKGGRDLWISWLTSIMQECFRVLKPGAHALIWALPRTSHWTMFAIENAGFEIRDVVTHIFSTGMPKGYDIAKGIENVILNGTASWNNFSELPGVLTEHKKPVNEYSKSNVAQGYRKKEPAQKGTLKLIPTTQEAAKYKGYNTALKPASEAWILARKPISETSIARNVLKWGTGGLNIDVCRIEGIFWQAHKATGFASEKIFTRGAAPIIDNIPDEGGRYPANLILTHSLFCTPEGCDSSCPCYALDQQSGQSKSQKATETKNRFASNTIYRDQLPGGISPDNTYEDEGGASRFFNQFRLDPEEDFGWLMAYINKPAPKERKDAFGDRNNHPTVKSLELMNWLIRLITPADGIVLDCFGGSGTTPLAARNAGFKYLAIEKEDKFIDIIKRRLAKGSLDDLVNGELDIFKESPPC